ncbi:SDR family NAD(P)-dependent oxidoreductase [Nocardioides pyridinolyticus]
MTDRRTALVTGGAGGIGVEVCRELAADGHFVVVADLSLDAAQQVAAEFDGLGIAFDVTSAESIAAGLAAIGAVADSPTIVANVAGWDNLMPFLDTDEAFSQKVVDINLHGPIRVLRATLPAMVEARWGRVVNVASDAGRVGSSLEAVYSGAKGGVIAFTKTIAREFARYGISANNVCPGPTDTPLFRDLMGSGEKADRTLNAMVNAVPMRRLGLPSDVAPAVRFLASEPAGYITGQTISCSGGLTMS